MSCHQATTERRRRHHHAKLIRTGAFGKQFRVTGILNPGRLPCFLVDRSRDNARHVLGQRGFD